MQSATLDNNIIHNTFNLDLLDYALQEQLSDLHFKVCPQTGMKAIIAIHNTKLGPALGGCRLIEYPNTPMAIYDAMRLARGMSYKSALANLPLGGGKAVIIKPNHQFDRSGYMHQFGSFIDQLGGRYITALDSGTQLSDMDIIAQHTPYVASLSLDNGDPSPSTAMSTLRGIQAAVLFKLGKESLEGLHITIQGLGHVGYALACFLHEQGALLTVADIDQEKVQLAVNNLGAASVSVADIHQVPCDVFSPCALGGIINDVTVGQLQTKIIAGAANNQLAHPINGQQLQDIGILYAPDYVINAGGVIFAASKYFKTPVDVVNKQIDAIYDTLVDIFSRASHENYSTSQIADRLAEEKLA